jgi:hypothetical protein
LQEIEKFAESKWKETTQNDCSFICALWLFGMQFLQTAVSKSIWVIIILFVMFSNFKIGMLTLMRRKFAFSADF